MVHTCIGAVLSSLKQQDIFRANKERDSDPLGGSGLSLMEIDHWGGDDESEFDSDSDRGDGKRGASDFIGANEYHASEEGAVGLIEIASVAQATGMVHERYSIQTCINILREIKVMYKLDLNWMRTVWASN